MRAKQRAIWVASPVSLLWQDDHGDLGPAPWGNIDQMLSTGVSILQMCPCDMAGASVLMIVTLPVPSEPEAKSFEPTGQTGYGIAH